MVASMGTPQSKSPWMTRREAAEYLRKSTDSLDRLLAGGKFRFNRMGVRREIRIWAKDIIAYCPPPEGEELPEFSDADPDIP